MLKLPTKALMREPITSRNSKLPARCMMLPWRKAWVMSWSTGNENALPDAVRTGGNFDFFFNDTATTEIYPLSLHDALPIYDVGEGLLASEDRDADDHEGQGGQ